MPCERSLRCRSAAWIILTMQAATAVAAEPVVAPPKPMTPAAKAIGELLAVDTTPGKGKLEPAQLQYRQALAIAPRDAGLEYAYSLVLQRLFQASEAREHLQRALEIEPGFVPAQQAAIRESIKAQQFQDAGERLATLASRIDRNDPQASELTWWVGRIVSCVIGAVGSPDAQSAFIYQDRSLRMSLPPVLLAAYERGYADVQQELEDYRDLIEQARSQAEDRKQVKKAQVDSDLADDQNEIKLKQQDATKTRQKWDEWVVDQTAKADDLLKEQEKRYNDLENAATTQLTAVTALRLAIDRIDRGLVPQQNLSGFTAPNRVAVELQLALEERKLAVIYSNQEDVSRAAAETVAGRRNAVAQYRQATGVVMKEVATLDRWEKRNKTVAENMKKASDKKPPQVATLEAKLRSLNTWDPVDFESEKRRLLVELGAPATP